MAGGLKVLAALYVAASCWTSLIGASSDLLARQSNYTLPSNTTLPYRNAALGVEERVNDLLARMTLAEKAGVLFQHSLAIGPDGALAGPGEPGPQVVRNSTEFEVKEKLMNHFNLGGFYGNVTQIAAWHNLMQQTALETRLGIPITISSDPRHSAAEYQNTWFPVQRFSQWPENLGLGALRDPEIVRQFAETAREEYKAVGIRVALHPGVDLSTEYRWSRVFGTFGEDANLTSTLAEAYIQGFQGDDFGKHSVASVTKHFPGAGVAENGEDAHFTYGKNATYPGHNMEYHLTPFKAAIAAGTRQMIPYYSRPINTEYEPVAFGFNKGILTDLLQEELGFEGIICADWGLITDDVIRGQDMPARAWGVESLSELERLTKMLEAGVDLIGGETRTELVIELVEKGIVSEERIDVSVRKLLKDKFILGLFDNPFVDVERAITIVGNTEYKRLGDLAQRASYTLLKNQDNILPIKNPNGMKVYTSGFNVTHFVGRDVQLVDTPEEADIAFVRLAPPFTPRSGGFEQLLQAGTLEYDDTEKARQSVIYSAVPTIVDITLTRPAAIPEIAEQAAAVLGNYGANQNAFLDVVFNVNGSKPLGKLPFDLPRSTQAVDDSYEDVPFDTANPAWHFGDGLGYVDC